MKKLMIAVAIVCTMFAFPACGKNADNKTENNVNLTNNDVTTAQTEVTDEVPDENTSLPDRSTLEKIPDEAVDSFNQVVDVCKEIYPLAEKTKRLYGYTGTKTVNKKNCYIFVIYDKNDDVLTKVATVAAEVASDKLYVLDDETGSAEKINTEDVKTQSTESWADQVLSLLLNTIRAKRLTTILLQLLKQPRLKQFANTLYKKITPENFLV